MAANNDRNNFIKRLRRPADILAAGVLLALLIGLTFLGLRYARFLLLDMEEAQAFSQELDYTAHMVVIRSEYPVAAAEGGVFAPALSAGERVRAGDCLGYTEWEGRQQPVYSPQAGLVYYDADGWESSLSPGAMDEIGWLELISAMEQTAETDQGDEAEAAMTSSDLAPGRTVARIVDNLSPIYVFLYGESLPAAVQERDTVVFRLGEDPEITMSARVTLLSRLDGYRGLLAEVASPAAELYQLRTAEVTMSGELVSGIAVPFSAMAVDAEGHNGVYVQKGRYLEFVPVKVIYSDEETAVVDGIDAGMRVAARPQHAKEGQRIYAGK